MSEDVELPGPGDSYYRSVITSDGHIVVGLRRCEGQVVDLQCTEERWWYFETDELCEPQAAGTYRQALTGECFETEGAASVYFDAPLLEQDVCGFDAQSEDLRGTHEVMAVASGQLCPDGEDFGAATLLSEPLSLQVDQDPDALRNATVTLRTGQFPCLDGFSFPAEVIGATVTAEYGYYSEGDSTECYPTGQVKLSFGSVLVPPFIGTLDFLHIRDDPCTASLPGYAAVSGFHFMPAGD